MCGISQNPTFFKSHTHSRHVYLQHNQLNHCLLGDNSVTHRDTMKGLHVIQVGPMQPLAQAGKASELRRVVSWVTVNIPAVGTSQKVLVPVGYWGTSVWHLFLSGPSIHSCCSHSLSSESDALGFNFCIFQILYCLMWNFIQPVSYFSHAG